MIPYSYVHMCTYICDFICMCVCGGVRGLWSDDAKIEIGNLLWYNSEQAALIEHYTMKNSDPNSTNNFFRLSIYLPTIIDTVCICVYIYLSMHKCDSVCSCMYVHMCIFICECAYMTVIVCVYMHEQSHASFDRMTPRLKLERKLCCKKKCAHSNNMFFFSFLSLYPSNNLCNLRHI